MPYTTDSVTFETCAGISSFSHPLYPEHGDIQKISCTAQLQTDLYIGWSDVTVMCGHITVSMLWGNMAHCVKLSGEDLSRYSNKIESVGLRKCPYYHYLTKKVTQQ